MAALRDIVVDSAHPAAHARFWAAALDGYAVRQYDGAEIARLAALGFTPETDPSVFVDGPGPSFCFQQMDPVAGGRSRMHVDLAASDRPAEVARLVALGARVREARADLTILLDPEGCAFCVLDA